MLNRFLYSTSRKNDNISSKKIGRGVTQKSFFTRHIYFLCSLTSLGIGGTMWKTVAIIFRPTERKTLLFLVVTGAIWLSTFILTVFAKFFSERTCPIHNSKSAEIVKSSSEKLTTVIPIAI